MYWHRITILAIAGSCQPRSFIITTGEAGDGFHSKNAFPAGGQAACPLVIRLARSTADTGVLDDDAWPLVGAGVLPDAGAVVGRRVGASSGMGGDARPG